MPLTDVSATATDAPVVGRCHELLVRAVGAGARYVHLEPTEDNLLVRYRIGRALTTADTISADGADALRRRYKQMAHIEPSIEDQPQEGSFRLRVDGRRYDVTLSTHPTILGEKIVMQLAAHARARRRGPAPPVLDLQTRHTQETPDMPTPTFGSRSTLESPVDLLPTVYGDQELLQAIIDLFFEDVPRLLGLIRDGVAARDAAATSRAAQMLRGSASVFGASTVVALTRQLEARVRKGPVSAAAETVSALERALDLLQLELNTRRQGRQRPA